MSDPENTTQLQVRYDTVAATYANQIMVSANREDIILDFSSGAIPDPNSDLPVLPIHSRIALSWTGAVRLRGLLDQAIERQAQSIAQGQAQAQPEPEVEEKSKDSKKKS